mgnify:CR=1 FL=1
MSEDAKQFAAAVKQFANANKESSALAAATFGKDGAVGKGVDKLVNRLNVSLVTENAAKVKNFIMERKMQKKEMEMLRDRLGLTKDDFKVMMATKKNNDAFNAMQQQFASAAENLLGFNPEFIKELNERNEKGQFRSTENMIAAIDLTKESLAAEMRQNNILQEGRINMAKKTQKNRAKAEEEQAEANAKEEKRTSLLESMANGITTLNKSFLLGLKDKGKFALAGLAALIAAPVVMLVNFFKQLAVEFAFLKVLVKGGFRLVTAPVRIVARMFNSLINLNKTAGSPAVKKALLGIEKLGKTVFSGFEKMGNFLRAVKAGGLEKVGNLLGKARPALTTLKNFLAPVGQFFQKISSMTKTLVRSSQTARSILGFAKSFGTLIGKLFLPVTIVMSAFDLVTGFVDGFTKKEGSTGEKIFAGIKAGLQKLISNLVGLPLKLLTKGIAWVAGLFGFDETSKDISSFADKIPKLISDLVGAPFDLIEAILDFDFLGLLKKIIPDKLLSLVGLGGPKKPPEQVAAEEAEKQRQKEIRAIERDIKSRNRRMRSLKSNAENQGYLESDASQARAVQRYANAQKELEEKKAELAALRAQQSRGGAGGATAIDASQTRTDVTAYTTPMTNAEMAAIPY